MALSRVGPLSILKIRGTNPLTLVDGGRDLKRKAEGLDELIGKQVHAVQELEQEWKGKAANAARGQAYRNIEHQHRFHEIIDAMATAMIAGGQVLATLRDGRRAVRHCLSRATTGGPGNRSAQRSPT
ncbi:Uncharacterised protein [Mycobacteroides abscessus subsp. abscessus]|nr:Uncharacterised protein [Mycobacteroides abscessus subsp. abscessus]